MKWLDGHLLADEAPCPVPDRPSPFETMRASARALPLFSRHLSRLRSAAARLGLPCREPEGLEAAALDLLVRNGHPRGVVRLLLVPAAARVHWLLTTRRAPESAPVRLLPCLCRRPRGSPPADLKAEPRAFYDAVLEEARAGTADDGIVLGDRGELLETALANLFLLLDDGWVTPPLDGRILPGIARAVLLERARDFGLGIAERPCDLADLHRARALATTNAVHGPRPAALLGQPVGELDTRLRALWRDAVPD